MTQFQGGPAEWVIEANALTRRAKRAPGAALHRGIALYRKAFRYGYTAGGYNLAVTYQNRGQLRAAVAWFRRVVEAGDLSALLPLALAEFHGCGTVRRPAAAISKLRRIARGGRWFTQFDQEQAMVTLARLLLDGWVIGRDHRAAVRWLERATSLGSAEARGLLDDLRDGDGRREARRDERAARPRHGGSVSSRSGRSSTTRTSTRR